MIFFTITLMYTIEKSAAVSHVDFLNSTANTKDGHTKVYTLFDQTKSGAVPRRINYFIFGKLFTPKMVRLNICAPSGQ